MINDTRDSFLGFPLLLSLTFLPSLSVEPWLTIRLRVTIKSISKRFYMTISTTIVIFPRRFLVASVMRVHMLSMMLGHVILHHELSFLIKRNKLLNGIFDLLFMELQSNHIAFIFLDFSPSYNISSNISESLFNIHTNCFAIHGFQKRNHIGFLIIIVGAIQNRWSIDRPSILSVAHLNIEYLP